MLDDRPLLCLSGPWAVPIEIEWSFATLAVAVVLLAQSVGVAGGALIYVALLTLSVFLHELGHAWASRLHGTPVRRIVLYAGGGYCLHAAPASRDEEVFILLMGPLVNLALWAVAGVLTPMVPAGDMRAIVEAFAYMNLFLAVMNLAPMMPLDGGRLFHLFLQTVLPDGLAYRTAGGVGLIISILWVPFLYLAMLRVGVLVLFLPSVALHWRMLQGRAVD